MHYGVLVFSEHNGDDVDELLAPYSENIEVDKYIRYTSEEAREKGKERIASTIDFWKSKLADPNVSDENIVRGMSAIERLEKADPYNYIRDDYEDDMVDSDGNLYSTYNPDSRWDWYSIGGRFSGDLRTNKGEYVDDGYAKDLDFGRDEEAYQRNLRFWEIVVEGSPIRDDEEEPFIYYKKEYYIKSYKNKETFADVCSKPIYHAVVTPDGKWHEPGKMGWFASLADEEDELEWRLSFEERFLNRAKANNWYVTLVDCHI